MKNLPLDGSALSGAQFREAMEHSPIGTAMVGTDGRWLWTNIALRQMLGYSIEELAARTFQDITYPPDLSLDLESVNRLLAGDIPGYQMEKRYICADGGLFWALLTVALVRNDAGQPDYFISNIQNIDARKAAELERSELIQRLTLATKAGGIGVWDWDIATGALIWDARMHELYDVPPSIGPDYDTFMSRVHERDRKRIDLELTDAVAGLRPYDTEFTIALPDGDERQIRALATVVHENGKSARVIGTNLDITETRRLSALAEASAKSKSEFLANMSHELRTPLNAVVGFSDLILKLSADRNAETAVGLKSLHYVQLICDSSKTLLSVVNDVLEYSRIEAGGFELDPHEFDLAALFTDVVEIVRQGAEAKRLILSLEFTERLVPHLIGDSARIRQILFNLLSNAIKFTYEGEVRLLVETHSAPEPGAPRKIVRVRVQDSGIGIEPSRRHLLFKRFSQADQSIVREFGGTGLGLAISERLVTAMNGSIGLDCTRVNGSEFWFELSLPVAEARIAPVLIAGAAAVAPCGDKLLRRVLLAEDNAVNQQLAIALLTRGGHQVEVVADGAAAVQAVQRGPFDIIFMDVQMPVMDGLEATRRIRAFGGKYSSMPIVAVTANVMKDDVTRYLDSGVTDHIGKPYQLADMERAIDKWCLHAAATTNGA